MIKFGASFGFAVMGRISLLIGRFEELIKFSSYEMISANINKDGVAEVIKIYNPTIIILLFMMITLTYWAYKDKKKDAIEE